MIELNNLQVRTATTKDKPVLLLYEQMIIQAEREFDKNIKEDPVHYYDLDWLLQSDEARVVVVEHDHQIVGTGYAKMVLAKEEYKYKAYSYLGFMCVHPDFRGQGINSLVINDLIQWSLDKGLTEIRLEVYDNNIQAIKAYEKAGFVPHVLDMRYTKTPNNNVLRNET